MKNFYADLHIHIGRTKTGRPVKITGAKSLTIDRILDEASARKGIDLVGVIDCQVPEVLDELTEMAAAGFVEPLDDGGLRFEKAVLIPGVEIEVKDNHCLGPLHVLAYFPNLQAMRAFSKWLASHMTNVTLSTQRFYGDAQALQQKVKAMGGLFIPAHIFTPFKSVYGAGVSRSITEILDPNLIDAVELGLSADTDMADQISELHPLPFVTNSDAHSLKKIGREYQTLRLDHPSFSELEMAFKGLAGRKIVANYGLDPKLGKYHRTRCANCMEVLEHYKKGEPCPYCGHKRVVKGVRDRLCELDDHGAQKPKRPLYVHQVPLEFIPKIGPKTLEKLLKAFGTEMAVMHQAPADALIKIVGEKPALAILAARAGELEVETGGAGRYGRVKTD
ncbi:endonuclease Q family protein [Camelliibacillus cellulosilyticus]|uniref:Endonuclease Q family protein n=1 Tax=Camelliibacillus cellulosilyticus TaxID=2174486 RepID=A0ABV9GL39_9BACL